MRDLKMKALSISKLINNLQLSKISHSANKVAHLIAKYSFDNRLDGILVNNVPPCVVNHACGVGKKICSFIAGRSLNGRDCAREAKVVGGATVDGIK